MERDLFTDPGDGAPDGVVDLASGDCPDGVVADAEEILLADRLLEISLFLHSRSVLY
jgi:hypothetical protein